MSAESGASAAPRPGKRARVAVTVERDGTVQAEHEFDERTTALIGRARDCNPRLDKTDAQVSRHHCLLDVNPPHLRVRDLGSLNGTSVNGDEIGRRRPGQTPEEGARVIHRERDLLDGDEIRVGKTLLRVSVQPAAGNGADPVVIPRAQPVALTSIEGYEPIREIGRGGQGVVYLARKAGSEDPVALKVLRPDGPASAHARDGFLREIATTRALRHENIVRYRDSGVVDGAFYLVSQYCPGGSVDQLRAGSDRALSVERALELTLQVLDGLHYAHHVPLPTTGSQKPDVGLVHRDIKPHNILLSSNGTDAVARLGDFGLAKAFDRAGLSGHTRTGAVGGTVAFMARTQLIDYRAARPEVDVWATAATLYWMLTGTTPRDFPAGTDPILTVLHDKPVPIRDRNPAIPRTLANVIDEALVDDPAVRITSAIELAVALSRC